MEEQERRWERGLFCLLPDEIDAGLDKLDADLITAGSGLAGDLIGRDTLDEGVFDSDTVLLAVFGLDDTGDETLMVSFLSLIMPLLRILRGVE